VAPLPTPNASSDASSDVAAGGGTDATGNGIPRAAWILGGGCLVLVALVVVLVVVLSTRGIRRPVAVSDESPERHATGAMKRER
jgi:hypothetical protein